MNAEWLQETRRALEAAVPNLQWELDDWVGAALCVIVNSAADAARAALTERCGGCWDSGTLADAPGEVRSLADDCGGLRSGQLLFAANAAGPVAACVAWWPWGGGDRVSLRLMLVGRGEGAPGKDELLAVVKTAFGF